MKALPILIGTDEKTGEKSITLPSGKSHTIVISKAEAKLAAIFLLMDKENDLNVIEDLLKDLDYGEVRVI